MKKVVLLAITAALALALATPAAWAHLVEGTSGPDTIQTGDGPDTLWGKGGNDRLLAGGGNDRLYGMVGNDRLFGQGGEDQLYGGPGDDFLNGGDDGVSDEFFGGRGTDTCVLRGPDNSAQNKTNCDIVVH